MPTSLPTAASRPLGAMAAGRRFGQSAAEQCCRFIGDLAVYFGDRLRSFSGEGCVEANGQRDAPGIGCLAAICLGSLPHCRATRSPAATARYADPSRSASDGALQSASPRAFAQPGGGDAIGQRLRRHLRRPADQIQHKRADRHDQHTRTAPSSWCFCAMSALCHPRRRAAAAALPASHWRVPMQRCAHRQDRDQVPPSCARCNSIAARDGCAQQRRAATTTPAARARRQQARRSPTRSCAADHDFSRSASRRCSASLSGAGTGTPPSREHHRGRGLPATRAQALPRARRSRRQ